MAIATLNLTVNFTAQSEGDHRVCWRVRRSDGPTTGAYNCDTIINCGALVNCSTVLETETEDSACTSLVYMEGYVQPTCYDINNMTGRVNFSQSFEPIQSCKSFKVTCLETPIENLIIRDGGYGYAPGETFVIVPNALGLSEVNGQVTLTSGGGAIIAYQILNTGLNYVVGDLLNVVGAGSGADVQVGSVGINGEILTIVITTPGNGYVMPTISSITSTLGFGGVVTVSSDYSKIVSGVVDAGGLYNEYPTLTLPPFENVIGQYGAIIDFVMAIGSSFSYLNCQGATTTVAGLKLKETLTACTMDESITPASDYSVESAGCCTENPIRYTVINNTITTLNFHYVNESGETVFDTVVAQSSKAICAIEDSVVSDTTLADPSLVSFVKGSSCDTSTTSIYE